MRRLLVCLIAGLLSAGTGHAQMLQNILTPAPIVVLGQTTISGLTSANESNIQFFTEVATPATSFHALSCAVYVGTVGTAGDKIECGLYSNNAGLPGAEICVAQYTETGTEASQFVTVPLAGCGTLAASTDYWVFFNMNDAATTIGDYFCGGSCSGTFPAPTAPTYYFFDTFGAYPTNPAAAAATSRGTFTVSLQ